MEQNLKVQEKALEFEYFDKIWLKYSQESCLQTYISVLFQVPNYDTDISRFVPSSGSVGEGEIMLNF